MANKISPIVKTAINSKLRLSLKVIASATGVSALSYFSMGVGFAQETLHSKARASRGVHNDFLLQDQITVSKAATSSGDDVTSTSYIFPPIGGSLTVLGVAGHGNVGIGNPNPAHRLSFGPHDSAQSLALYENANGGAFYGLGAHHSGLRFHAETAKDAEGQMVLTNMGNFGIGTLTPAHRLSFGTATSQNQSLALYENSSGGEFYGLGANDYRLRFHANTAKDSAGQMVLTTDGRLGIGTMHPAHPLDVTGSIHSTGFVYFGSWDLSLGADDQSTRGNTGLSRALVKAAGGILSINYEGDFKGGVEIQGKSSKTVVFMQAEDPGYVGIGTKSPTVPLEVKGNPAVSWANGYYLNARGSGPNRSASDQAISIKSNGYMATDIGFLASSDRRLKEDIVDVEQEQALEFLESARPVRFKWKGKDGHHYGFIAQDIARIGLTDVVQSVPEKDNKYLVKTEEDGLTSVAGIKLTLDYNQLISILTQGVKYVYFQFKNLAAEVQRHDKALAAKDEEIKALKTYLCAKDPLAPFCN